MYPFVYNIISPLFFALLGQAISPRDAPPTLFEGLSLKKLDDRTWQATPGIGESAIDIDFPNGTAFVFEEANGQYVLPTDSRMEEIRGKGRAWWVPANATSVAKSHSTPFSYMLRADGPISARCDGSVCHVSVSAQSANLTAYEGWPRADIHGDEFSLDFPGGDTLSTALAAFYWTSMLPMVVERTRATSYPISDGFIISTLASTYSGTYPDVDHEFHIKGRVAMGSELDLSIVARMIELELKLAREDYCGLWRTPCALQPDGAREYNVRRNSEDGKTNAVMFLVTGNVELLESAWLYVARSKDMIWLATKLQDLELVAWAVEDNMDSAGRLWSDVYYEDQVIKDGRETMSAALAARAFGLIAELEKLLGREELSRKYSRLQLKLSRAIAEPLPAGYWNPSTSRFTDWVDRNGWAHDHIHLLANILPVMQGISSDEQTSSVLSLVDTYLDEFQRFPTFLAARIQDYNSTEIGEGGPYDLCAAGRYWCWDAAFWYWRKNGTMLRQQLHTVADMARSDAYIMGERYDMDHVYYVDGIPWHGASHYYEYPCVFAWVLFHDYIGVRQSLDADVIVSPRLVDHGTVTLRQAAYRLSYQFRSSEFRLHNLAPESRTFRLDLSAIYPHGSHMTLHQGRKQVQFENESKLTIAAGDSLSVTIRPGLENDLYLLSQPS